ncbi:hypothetical protein GCM10009111_15260 [Colwellia asteriadis]|uniref:Uncharacterized protein n=1 Tax=Colwellia asteriadis TaxID=517723 RepID=A0ABN1L645_9GAMM
MNFSVNPYVSNTVTLSHASDKLTVPQKTLTDNESTTPTTSQTLFISEVAKVNFNFANWLKEPIQAEFSDEKKEKLALLYEKLPEDKFIHLARMGVTSNDDLLAMVPSLDEKQLTQLSDVIAGVGVSANMLYTHLNEYAKHGKRSGAEKVAQFLEVLANSKRPVREQLIENASQYTEQVNIYREQKKNQVTYSPLGEYNNPRSSANDLQNFISTVIDAESPATLVNKLNQYTSTQQSQLLNVLGFDREQGEALLNALMNKSENTKDSILSFIGNLALKANPFLEMKVFNSSDVGYRKGYGDNLHETVAVMVEQTVSLLSEYSFGDTQLENIGVQLNKLHRKEQIAYLEVATIGLENLLSDKTQGSVTSLTNDDQQQALRRLSPLLSNKSLLNIVYQTREGEEREHGQFFTPKSQQQYQQDLTTTIKHFLPSSV